MSQFRNTKPVWIITVWIITADGKQLCVYTFFVNKLLNGEKSTRSRQLHPCKWKWWSRWGLYTTTCCCSSSLWLSASITQSEGAQPLVLVVFFFNAVRKSKCSFLKSRNSFHNVFMLSLHFTRGVISAGRETENHNCMCLNTWNSCCVNIAWPRQKSVPGNPSISEPNGI